MHQRGVEQLAARRAHNPKVAGSSPAPATKIRERSAIFVGRFFLPASVGSDPRVIAGGAPCGNMVILRRSGVASMAHRPDSHGGRQHRGGSTQLLILVRSPVSPALSNDSMTRASW